MRNTSYLRTKVEKRMHREIQNINKQKLLTQIFIYIICIGNNKALLRSNRYVLISD